MKTNVIVDGGNLLHRTYHSSKSQSLINSKGVDVGHILYFLNSLKRYNELLDADNKYLCWDIRDSEFNNHRHILCEGYKTTRNKDAHDIIHKYDKLLWVLAECLGFKCLRASKLEADDIIYWLSVIHHEGDKNVVVSNDRDFYQLVDKGITLFNPIKSVYINEQNFINYSDGVKPEHYYIYRAIVGDSSDNVKGVYGYGPKKTKNIIEKYQNVKDIIEFFKPNDQKIILNNFKIMNLNYGLIIYEDEINYYNEQIKTSPVLDLDKVFNCCEKLELNSILSDKRDWVLSFEKQSIFAGIVSCYFD